MTDFGAQEQTGFLRGLARRLASAIRQWSQPANCDSFEGAGDHRSLSIAPEVGASVHQDGLALLHIPTGRVFVCNRIGSRIWQGLVRGLSIDAISEEISRECGVTRELVERHTSSFLTELEHRGLVTRRAGAKS